MNKKTEFCGVKNKNTLKHCNTAFNKNHRHNRI